MQVFPKGSAMSADVSRAIVSLTEGGEMARIERKWFGGPGACDSQGSGGVGASSLCFWSFSGLFLVTGVASGLSLVVYLTTLAYWERNELRAAEPAGAGSMSLRRLRAWLQHYDRKDTRSPSFKRRDDDGSVRRNVVDAKQQISIDEDESSFPRRKGRPSTSSKKNYNVRSHFYGVDVCFCTSLRSRLSHRTFRETAASSGRRPHARRLRPPAAAVPRGRSLTRAGPAAAA